MVTQSTYPTRRTTGDKRGQVLAMAAVSMVAVIAVGALAVDLGLAFAARASAQRAADSSALAGASAFIDFNFATNQEAAVEAAEARAYEYALNNDVLARPIQPSQVTVWVIPDTQKVRVRIAATDLPTWFARVLGVFSMDVAAVAAAMASDAGTTNQCVLPFAMPDLWHDVDDDANGNRLPDAEEEWEFSSIVDKYLRYTPVDQIPDSLVMQYSGYANGTGLGSSWRDGQPPGSGIANDVGRRIWLKAGPQGGGLPSGGGDAGDLDEMIGPGNFLIWRMPDPDQACQGRPGADWVRENIKGCNECDVSLGVEYRTEPGNVASITQAFQEVIAQDPNAVWSNGEIINSDFGEGQSPRIRIVPLWNPGLRMQGNSPINFNNFAKVFLEGGSNPPDFPIYARFLGTVSGGVVGPNTGSLVKYLRLVE